MNVHQVERLVEIIRACAHPGRTTALIAIDGHGGAGKSTLAAALADRLNATIVHCDDLAANPSHPSWRRRLKELVIEPLLDDRPARYGRYDWRTGETAGTVQIEPGGIVIVEGVSTLHSDLGEPWDLGVWIDCPLDVRLARGIERDGEESRSRWLNEWVPEEDEYVAAENPKMKADFVYDGSGRSLK